MPDTTEQLLHHAAPKPGEPPDFDHLWDRGRRRRRVARAAAALAGVAVLGIGAAATALVSRPADSQVDFAQRPSSPPATAPAEERTDPAAPSLDPGAAQNWQTVLVGDAAFDVPPHWPVYGDDSAGEYLARFCDVGQVGPAVFVAHPLPDNRMCDLMLRGAAPGVHVATDKVFAKEGFFGASRAGTSTTTEMGGEPVTRWEQDARLAGKWTLLRFDRLGIYVHARVDLDRRQVLSVLQSFRPTTAQDRAAESQRVAARAEQRRHDRRLAKRLIDIAVRGPQESSPLSDNALQLGLAGEALMSRTPEQLQDRSGWELRRPRVFRALVGPFSALDVLARHADETRKAGRGAFVVTDYDFGRCGSGAIGSPAEMQRYRRVSIRPAPATYDSCLEWFAVDLYVDGDGSVRGVTLDFYEP